MPIPDITSDERVEAESEEGQGFVLSAK
jgi:hypothetical protein